MNVKKILAALMMILCLFSITGTAFPTLANAANKQFELFYDANGGNGDMQSSKCNYGSYVQIPRCKFSKTGYKFTGWSKSKNGPVQYDTYNHYVVLENSASSSAILYAIWEPNVYTIEFDAHGGDGTMQSVAVKYDQEYILPECAFTKKGYTFIGWSTGSWDKPSFQPGDAVKNLRTGDIADNKIKLYPAWQENHYTLILCSNNGLDQTRSFDVSCVYDKTLPYVNFEKTGYHLIGWSLTKNGDVKYDKLGHVEPLLNNAGTANLYAVWEPNTYTITFDGNGGAGSMDPIVCTYDQPTKLPKSAFTKEGYAFFGWVQSQYRWSAEPKNKLADDEDEVLNLTAQNDGKVSLFAIWIEGKYTIVYHSNDKSNSEIRQDVGIDSIAYLKKEPFNRKGYTFKGWATKAGGSVKYKNGQGIQSLAKAGETFDLYAVWEPKTYNVYYVGVGALNHPDVTKEVLTYDIEHKLLKNQFYRAGYVFNGWTKTVDTAPMYKDQEIVKNLTDESSVNLYVSWKKIMQGDVDGDGHITAADARTALRMSVGLDKYDLTDREYSAADIDEDSTITAGDARRILRAAVGLEKIA